MLDVSGDISWISCLTTEKYRICPVPRAELVRSKSRGQGPFGPWAEGEKLRHASITFATHWMRLSRPAIRLAVFQGKPTEGSG